MTLSYEYVGPGIVYVSQNTKTNERTEAIGMRVKIREKEVGCLFSLVFFVPFVVKGVTRLDSFRKWARFAVVLFPVRLRDARLLQL